MKPQLLLSLGVVSLLAIVPMVEAASSSSHGYVDYGVQITGNGMQRNLLVNESVTPTSNPAKSIFSLSVEAESSNFTYSHVVNSSSTLFPYMPAITNENYSYSTKSYNVTAKISEQGTGQVSFQGKTYTLTDYAFSATAVSAKGAQTLSGTVSAFPSDLVYSLSTKANGTQVVVTLRSTSLALSATSATPAVQAASAGVGISLAGAAVALSLGVRARHKHRTAESSKPDHWVD